jgi:hypothetical protein
MKVRPGPPAGSVGFELFDAAIAPLLECRAGLPGGVSSKEVRKKMRAKAEELGLVFPKKPVVIGGKKYPSDWVLDYVEMRAGGKTDFEVADILGGYYGFAKLPIAGHELPVMLTITSPFTSIKNFHEKVEYAYRKEFGPLMSLRPESVGEGAKVFAKRTKSVKYKDIADGLLEEEGAFEKIEADSCAEREKVYQEELLPRRTASSRQLFKRFADSVTKVMGLESRQ